MASNVTTSPYIPAWGAPQQYTYNSTYFRSVTGSNGQGLGLLVDPAEGWGSTDLGPLTAAFMGSSAAHTALGESTWYRVRFKLPSGAWHPAAGDFQWLMEWHEQLPCDGNSIGFGLSNWHYSTNPNLVQLLFRPGGGNGSSPTYEYWYSASAQNVPLAIQQDRWYDLVVNIVWDTKASNAGGVGRISIWLDGQVAPLRQMISKSDGDGPAWSNPHPFPTLYTDGCTSAVDHPTHGLYNYRKTSSSDRTDFDDWYVGPTAASVGFTP
jgi:hypothetical protein